MKFLTAQKSLVKVNTNKPIPHLRSCPRRPRCNFHQYFMTLWTFLFHPSVLVFSFSFRFALEGKTNKLRTNKKVQTNRKYQTNKQTSLTFGCVSLSLTGERVGRVGVGGVGVGGVGVGGGGGGTRK